jgi:P27 family predicted phage terminase small subunit
VLKRIDRAVVVAFCVAADIFRQAAIMQSKTGLLVKGRRDGDVIPSPLLRIMRGQAIVMFKAAEQLGFSPVARARIRSDAPPVVDDGGWSEIS